MRVVFTFARTVKRAKALSFSPRCSTAGRSTRYLAGWLHLLCKHGFNLPNMSSPIVQPGGYAFGLRTKKPRSRPSTINTGPA